MAMLLGSVGLFVKMKSVAWTALVLSILSILNRKTSEAGQHQGLSSLSFSVMGLVMTYMNLIALKQKELSESS